MIIVDVWNLWLTAMAVKKRPASPLFNFQWLQKAREPADLSSTTVSSVVDEDLEGAMKGQY